MTIKQQPKSTPRRQDRAITFLTQEEVQRLLLVSSKTSATEAEFEVYFDLSEADFELRGHEGARFRSYQGED